MVQKFMMSRSKDKAKSAKINPKKQITNGQSRVKKLVAAPRQLLTQEEKDLVASVSAR